MTATDGLIWPFLVSRARTAGHREVVVPGLLAGTPLAAVLASEVGTGTDFSETPSGRAIVQQISCDPRQPVSAIFRMYRAREADFGLGGDVPLLDGSFRQILVTEGFFTGMTSAQCAAAGFTVADLSAAHAAVVPCYQRFWEAEDNYETAFSAPMRQSRQGALLALRVMPGPGEVPARSRHQLAEHLPATSEGYQLRGIQAKRTRLPSRKGPAIPLRVLVAAIVGAGLIATGADYALGSHGASSPPGGIPTCSPAPRSPVPPGSGQRSGFGGRPVPLQPESSTATAPGCPSTAPVPAISGGGATVAG